MAWLLLTVTAVLAVLVVALAVLTLRLRSQVSDMERRMAARSPSGDPEWSPLGTSDDHTGPPDAGPQAATEFVITRIGEPEPEPVPTVPAPVFADLLLKETVVQSASLFQGLRRALSPEVRNRIRFQMRQEVKRSRKQRRADLREMRREWATRQRAAVAADERAEGSAA